MLAILILILMAGFVGLLALQWFENSKPTLTGQATVVSRRTDLAKRPTHRHGFNYFVTFALHDGEQIELFTTEEEFKQLKEGLTGQLTWQSRNFCDFT